jgi:hypothetical protein
MIKNTKLLYCILGSLLLALLNNPIFKYSKFGLSITYKNIILNNFINWSSSMLSLIGFILLILFSIILIINNIKFKDK